MVREEDAAGDVQWQVLPGARGRRVNDRVKEEPVEVKEEPVDDAAGPMLRNTPRRTLHFKAPEK